MVFVPIYGLNLLKIIQLSVIVPNYGPDLLSRFMVPIYIFCPNLLLMSQSIVIVLMY